MFNQHDDEFISQDTVSLSQVKVCTSSSRLAIKVTFQPQAVDIGDTLYMPKPPYNKPYLSIYCELIKGGNMYIQKRSCDQSRILSQAKVKYRLILTVRTAYQTVRSLTRKIIYMKKLSRGLQ